MASEDTLSDLLERTTLSEHRADSAGPDAMSVFANRSTILHINVDALRRYVPGEIKNHVEFDTRLAAIVAAEHEICHMRNNYAKLMLVSKEVRDTLRSCFASKPPIVHHRTLSRWITKCLRELLTDIKFKYKFVQWDDFHTIDQMTFETGWILGMLDEEFDEFVAPTPKDVADIYSITVRRLLCTLDVLPHLCMYTNETDKHELQKQCAHIAKLTHEYYDSVLNVDELDTFMTSSISFDDEIFTESRCAEAWNDRADAVDQLYWGGIDELLASSNDEESEMWAAINKLPAGQLRDNVTATIQEIEKVRNHGN